MRIVSQMVPRKTWEVNVDGTANRPNPSLQMRGKARVRFEWDSLRVRWD